MTIIIMKGVLIYHCTEPVVILPSQKDQPEKNMTYKVYLPLVDDSNGPFRLALILTNCFVS